MHLFQLAIGSLSSYHHHHQKIPLNTGSDLARPNLRLDTLLLKPSSGILGSSPLCSLQVNHCLIPAGSGSAFPHLHISPPLRCESFLLARELVAPVVPEQEGLKGRPKGQSLGR